MADVQDIMVKGPTGRLAVRAKGFAARPKQAVVLVQGANVTGQSGYDFSFPGSRDYSFLDALVAAGFGAVTFALRGYGPSDPAPDPQNITTDDAIADLAAVIDWMASQGHARPHVLGWSWGGRIAGRFCERAAERVDRLILMDPALGGGQLILPGPSGPFAHNTEADYLKRLQPEFTEPDAHAAFAKHVALHDAKSPSGILTENAKGSIPVRPEAITRPTLLIYGHAAARQNYMQGIMPRGEFWEKLATEDKALVLVPGGGDYAHLQRPRRLIHRAVIRFLDP
ncbi:MAG: alpha/beta fold hydrolase [Rhodospirillaceae bacterium]|nr:alpha/beta fold hydrolase [Rhodospirillaceae bacterium]